MTIKGRPEIKTTIHKTREAKLVLSTEAISDILIPYLKKTFPEFRGFGDIEFELTWSPAALSSVEVVAYKEYKSK